jgi:multicomponent Na+:H+ antiporter subunit D
VLCIGIGTFPGVFYALLPFEANYQPYSLDHVVAQMQLLFWSALAFTLLMRTGIYPPELRSTNLDFDWFYRRLGRRLASGLDDMAGKAWQWLAAGIASGAKLGNERLHRHHGPDGALGRTWPTGTMAFWTTVMLAAYLLLSSF